MDDLNEDRVAIDKTDLTFSAHVAETPIAMKTWALVKNGFVTALRRSEHYVGHPFGDDDENGRPPVVVDVTGVDCGIGYIVDAKGNVAPSEGRKLPLTEHEPAYHDRTNPLAPHTIDRAAQMSTGEPRYAADDKSLEVEQDKRVKHSSEETQEIAEGSAVPPANPE